MIERIVTTVRKASYDGCLEDPERLAESIVQKKQEFLGSGERL